MVSVLSRHEGVTAVQAIASVDDHRDVVPDLIILDVTLKAGSLGSNAAELRRAYPNTPIILISGDPDRSNVREAQDLGLQGFVSKSDPVDRLLATVDLVGQCGQTVFPARRKGRDNVRSDDIGAGIGHLTRREAEVLQKVCDGLGNKKIAEILDISHKTVAAHLSSAYLKLGVSSRAHAMKLLYHHTSLLLKRARGL